MLIAKVPDIAGCYTRARTLSQLMERVKEAIQVCIEAGHFESPKTKFVGLQTTQVWV